MIALRMALLFLLIIAPLELPGSSNFARRNPTCQPT